jgi:Leucine-rich repeat (LRR) protein
MTFKKYFFFLFFFISRFVFAQNDSLLIYAYPRGETNGFDVALTSVERIPNEIMQQKKIKRITFYECSGINMSSLVAQLQQFPNLVSLGFVECNFGRFPEEICALTNLRALTLVYDKISEVPESISKLSNLEFLDLGDALYSGDQIDKLPPSMSQLTKLRVLYLLGNNLKALPDFLSSLPLTYLNLRYNSLQDLAAIEKLSSIEELDISHNFLGTLPGIEKLQMLKSLDVSGCELTNETPRLDKLVNLEHLFIGENHEMNFDEIFNRLAKLPHLKELDLENSGLRKMPVSISNFPSLEILSLWMCDSLDFAQTFSVIYKIGTLRELSLRQCEIKKLPDNIVLLQQLRTLDLYFNKLESTDGLCELKNLEKLYLVENPLNSFDNCMRHLTFLKVLYLPDDLPDSEQAKAKKFFPEAEIEFY